MLARRVPEVNIIYFLGILTRRSKWRSVRETCDSNRRYSVNLEALKEGFLATLGMTASANAKRNDGHCKCEEGGRIKHERDAPPCYPIEPRRGCSLCPE